MEESNKDRSLGKKELIEVRSVLEVSAAALTAIAAAPKAGEAIRKIVDKTKELAQKI